MGTRAPAPPPYSTNPTVLAREVIVETMRAGGPGGQHRNVTESAVRLTHLPSGVRVVAADFRSQHRNRASAFERLIEKLTRLNQVRRPRVATRKSARADQRRLDSKIRRGRSKLLRGHVKGEE